jgi:hypothetical protein
MKQLWNQHNDEHIHDAMSDEKKRKTKTKTKREIYLDSRIYPTEKKLELTKIID